VESETREKSKRSTEDIARAIYEVLPDQDLITINDIADKIGSSWETVRRCLKFIEWHQNQPKIVSMRIGTRRYGYRKVEEKKGRKTK